MSKIREFIWSEGTQTIRAMPQNYMVAYRQFGRFDVGEMDSAIDMETAVAIFSIFRDYKTQRGDPREAVERLNKEIK